MFKTGIEFNNSLVDLLTVLVIIPLVMNLGKDYKSSPIKKLWFIFFILLGAGDFLGFIIHALNISELVVDIIWIVLYPIAFLICDVFLCIALNITNKDLADNKHLKYIILSITFILNVWATINGFFTVKEIRIFVVYAGIVGFTSLVIVLISGIKNRYKSTLILFTIMFPQLFGFYFQITKTGSFHLILDFDYDGIYHLCLLFSIIIIYISALISIKEQEELECETA